MPETRLHRLGALLPLILAALPATAVAQRWDGAVSGTLDCPARSIFETGRTRVFGMIRNNEVTLPLGQVTVSGRIMALGVQPAVRLDGSSGGTQASFDGLFVGANEIRARGILNDQPCNLNLTMAMSGAQAFQQQTVPPMPPTAPPTTPPLGPQAQFSQAQSTRAMAALDGPWSGSVTCPLRDLSGDDRIAARGSMVGNVLTVDFASIRVQGRMVDVSPRPALRLEGGGARGIAAGFYATAVTSNRIEGRGMVGNQPCTISLSRGPTAPPPATARPQAAPPPSASLPPKPAPSNQAALPPSPPPSPGGSGQVEKPAPSNAPPEPTRPPPVAAVTPRPPPAAPPAPAPAPRAPSGAADQLACALAGTCPTPAPR